MLPVLPGMPALAPNPEARGASADGPEDMEREHILRLLGETEWRVKSGRIATPYAAMHARARLYHIHHRRLYTAIGEPHSRFRKPLPAGRAMERLMILDRGAGPAVHPVVGDRARQEGPLSTPAKI
jgi:hypothetical protein